MAETVYGGELNIHVDGFISLNEIKDADEIYEALSQLIMLSEYRKDEANFHRTNNLEVFNKQFTLANLQSLSTTNVKRWVTNTRLAKPFCSQCTAIAVAACFSTVAKSVT